MKIKLASIIVGAVVGAVLSLPLIALTLNTLVGQGLLTILGAPFYFLQGFHIYGSSDGTVIMLAVWVIIDGAIFGALISYLIQRYWR